MQEQKKYVHRLIDLLTNNLWLKTTALLIAVALWFILTGGPRREETITVELGLDRHIPDGWSLSQPIENVLELTLRGRDQDIQRLLNVENARSSIFINFDSSKIQPTSETQVIEFDASYVSLPANVEMLSHSPTRLVIKLDKTIEESKPVSLNIAGDLRPGYILRSTEITPLELEVSGAESLVSQIDFVTADLNVENFGPENNIIAANINRNQLLRYSSRQVQARLDIVEVSATKRINVSQFNFLGIDESAERASYSPQQLTIDISGPRSWIELLGAELITVNIDTRSLQRNTRLEVEILAEFFQFTNPPARPELLKISFVGRSNKISLNILSQ